MHLSMCASNNKTMTQCLTASNVPHHFLSLLQPPIDSLKYITSLYHTLDHKLKRNIDFSNLHLERSPQDITKWKPPRVVPTALKN